MYKQYSLPNVSAIVLGLAAIVTPLGTCIHQALDSQKFGAFQPFLYTVATSSTNNTTNKLLLVLRGL